MNTERIAMQTLEGLGERLKERQEFISLREETAGDSLYEYTELTGPAAEVRSRVLAISLAWPGKASMLRTRSSDDGAYTIAVVRRRR